MRDHLQIIVSTIFLLLLLNTAEAGVRFVENKGQWEENVLFRADLPNGKLFVEKNVLTFAMLDPDALHEIHHFPTVHRIIDGHTVNLRFGTNAEADDFEHFETDVSAENPYPEYYNYFIGNKPDRWASQVNAYQKIWLRNVQPGVDVELIGKEGYVKYNLHLEAGIDPSTVNIQYEGAENIITEGNALVIETTLSPIRENMPLAYQPDENGVNHELPEIQYVAEGNQITFNAGREYNPDLPVTIDPEVIYSTYSGSYADNFGYTAAFDTYGNGYSGGTVFNFGFPVTSGAFQISYAGGEDLAGGYPFAGSRDVGILKFNPDGTQLEFATYLGGSGHNEDPHSMITNSNNELIVLGTTLSKDFPVLPNAFDTVPSDTTDIFLVRFSEDGSTLLASTFLKGSGIDGRNGDYVQNSSGVFEKTSPLNYNYGDMFRGEVIVDPNDNVLVATMTSSPDFPVTPGAIQDSFPGGMQSGVVFKMNPDHSNMIWGTFLGGNNYDATYGLRVDTEGNVYVAGGTMSKNFPVTANAWQNTFQGNKVMAIVSKLNNNATNLLASTFAGTEEYDQAYFLDLSPENDVWVTGQTDGNFPVSDSVYTIAGSGQFLLKLSNDLSERKLSTVFGLENTGPVLSPSAFMVDHCGNIYFSGWGGTLLRAPQTDFIRDVRGLEITPNALKTASDINRSAFYLALFSFDIKELKYASFFGGDVSDEHVDGGTSRFDPEGNIYQAVCAGCEGNSDFPATTGAYSETNNSTRCNNALFKLSLQAESLSADFDAPDELCNADTLSLKQNANKGDVFEWYIKNDTLSGEEVNYFFDSNGVFEIMLIVKDISGCLHADTAVKSVTVYNSTQADFSYSIDPCSDSVIFQNNSIYGTSFIWEITNDTVFSNVENPVYSFNQPGDYDVTLTLDSGTFCQSQITKTVHVDTFSVPGFDIENLECSKDKIFHFTGKANSGIKWLLEDSVLGSSESIQHTFNEPGLKTLSLVVDPEGPCTDTISKPVEADSLPLADFNYHTRPCAGEVVFNFNGIAPDSYEVRWDFGDGYSLVGTDGEHSYAENGTYTMSVAVSNEECIDSIAKPIVIDELLDMGFDFEVLACNNLIKFLNTSTGTNEYEWFIGDEKVSENKDSFLYHFPEVGYHNITLYGITENCKKSISYDVLVDSFPKAVMNYDEGECPGDFRFNAHGTTAENLTWSIDGNIVSYDPVYEVLLSGPGEYKVQLIAEPDSVCADTTGDFVEVSPQPISDFETDVNDCDGKVETTNNSQYSSDYLWDFGDGNLSDQFEDEHIYENDGEYRLSLIVNPGTICADTSEQTISWEVYDPDLLKIPNVFTPVGDNINDTYYISGIREECGPHEWIVFNRWGEKLVHKTEGAFTWDGTYMGEELEAGTYYFVLYGPGWKRNGTITLLR